jgi:hypothetical protein
MGKPQTAEASAVRLAFETKFPRLRLVSFRSWPKADAIIFSVAGAGKDLIDAKFLTQAMLDRLPRCGVKDFASHQVFKTKSGFRTSLILRYDEALSLLSAEVLREAWGPKVPTRAAGEPDLSAKIFSTVREWKAEHHKGLGMSFAHTRQHRIPSPEMKEIHAAIYGTRFRFAQEDVQRIDSILHRFREELAMAINQAAVVDGEASARPSHLRLVVDNDTGVQL